jgi:hypothetical protein
MIELVLLVCLAAAPASCLEERLAADNPTIVGCTIGGQSQAQAWLDDHPKWRLRRWRCEQTPPQRPA